ncbi:MAG: hypothetical protein H6907_12100 [Hyphomicrobiales bacterium]|nr:hypothetical protein [Hyphomicrobiales bacterium]MCP5372465.1 hypothetical protein [Hyphomicrobiales bacterium]
MRNLARTSLSALAVVGLVFMAGCATKAEVEALRADVVKAQQTADSAEQRAMSAEAAAKAAAEKADRIYRESLRK